jgi:predicted nucleic acid-binding protein
MDVPPFVAVDTSAAVEVLISDAEYHHAYVDLFERVCRNGSAIAYCDLLEAELAEAAFTWDVKRADPKGWRAARRDRPASARAREHEVLSAWRDVSDSEHALQVRMTAVVDDAVELMSTTGLASYDAIHLAVALALNAPLMAHDRRLLLEASQFGEVLTCR